MLHIRYFSSFWMGSSIILGVKPINSFQVTILGNSFILLLNNTVPIETWISISDLFCFKKYGTLRNNISLINLKQGVEIECLGVAKLIDNKKSTSSDAILDWIGNLTSHKEIIQLSLYINSTPKNTHKKTMEEKELIEFSLYLYLYGNKSHHPYDKSKLDFDAIRKDLFKKLSINFKKINPDIKKDFTDKELLEEWPFHIELKYLDDSQDLENEFALEISFLDNKKLKICLNKKIENNTSIEWEGIFTHNDRNNKSIKVA